MSNSKTPANTQEKHKSKIVNAEACIKAIVISHYIEEIKNQIAGFDKKAILELIDELDEECKELALNGFTGEKTVE